MTHGCINRAFFSHRFVFDGWTGDAQVELLVFFNAGVDKGLN